MPTPPEFVLKARRNHARKFDYFLHDVKGEATEFNTYYGVITYSKKNNHTIKWLYEPHEKIRKLRIIV